MGKEPLILLFVKAPIPSGVKSRLAATIGHEAALCLYKNFVLDILETLNRSRYPCRICYYPPDAGGMVADWLGPGYQYEPQEGGDLGERMEHAFRKAFSDGRDSGVLIGSDIPDLPECVLDEAINAVQKRDIAVGPAADGGYYVIGLTKNSIPPDLFRGIAWGSTTVYQETVKAALRAGLSVYELPVWRDVDTIDDLQDLVFRSEGTVFSESRTMACLNKLAADGKLNLKRPAEKR